jgi:hypothetical protein
MLYKQADADERANRLYLRSGPARLSSVPNIVTSTPKVLRRLDYGIDVICNPLMTYLGRRRPAPHDGCRLTALEMRRAGIEPLAHRNDLRKPLAALGHIFLGEGPHIQRSRPWRRRPVEDLQRVFQGFPSPGWVFRSKWRSGPGARRLRTAQAEFKPSSLPPAASETP